MPSESPDATHMDPATAALCSGVRGTAREEFGISEEQQLLESTWGSKFDPQLHGAPR